MTTDEAAESRQADPDGRRPQAAPPGSVPDDPAEGVEPMAEVPGGPQVDVPAAQGHLPDDADDRGAPPDPHAP